MALTVNNNTSSLIAQYNLVKNTSELSKSVEKLSSGLRVNRAADDSASLFIASSLDSQALSMGQAIRNANDGISMMQVVDGSLEEAIDIINSIKTKAIQAAQETQTSSTRQTIQSDIDKLLTELDLIAETTTFNNQKLINGIFTDKKFQIGANSGQTISVSLNSAETPQIGHIRTGQISVTNTTGGSVSLSFTNKITNDTLDIKSITIDYSNTADNSMAALATAINNFSDTTGISGRAVVESTSSDPVAAGATSTDFAINGISIGSVTTQANDADGSLVTAINNKTTSHGVTASITSSGQLSLTSSDGRPIELTGAGTALAAADASNMSTFGYVQVYQQGSYDIDMTDNSAGLAVSFSANMNFTGSLTASIDSTLAADSVIGTGSTLAAEWSAGATIIGTDLTGDIATTASSTLKAGSVLATGSVIEKNSVLGGSANNNSTITTTANSLLKSGSTLASGTVLEAGTYITVDIDTTGGPIAAGSTLSSDTTLTSDASLTSDMLLLNGSVIQTSSTLAAGSYIGEDFTLGASSTLSQDMTLLANSTIKDVDGETSIAAGSIIGGVATTGADITLTRSMTLKSTSVLTSASSIAAGSTLGGDATLNGDHTTTSDLSLAADSVLASGSILKKDTVLTNDINTTSGLIAAGTTLTSDVTTTGSNTLTYDMTIENGSTLASGSLLKANAGGAASVQLGSESSLRLSDLSVLTADDAQNAIVLADAALTDLNNLRSSAGSFQNQFSSSVNNLTTSKINIQNAKSTIMDVDFAAESVNFAKLQVLTQSGTFALTQANALMGNVLNLLQGDGG